MYYQNIVIGKPLVDPAMVLAADETDWANVERENTHFTESRYLPVVLREAGVVPSTSEVRRNRPELCVTLNQPNFFQIKWGKKVVSVLVGPNIPESEYNLEHVEFDGDRIQSKIPACTSKPRYEAEPDAPSFPEYPERRDINPADKNEIVFQAITSAKEIRFSTRGSSIVFLRSDYPHHIKYFRSVCDYLRKSLSESTQHIIMTIDGAPFLQHSQNCEKWVMVDPKR